MFYSARARSSELGLPQSPVRDALRDAVDWLAPGRRRGRVTAGAARLTTAAADLRQARHGASSAAARTCSGLQDADGYWWGELESNATIDRRARLPAPPVRPRATDDLRRRRPTSCCATQRDDGGWPVWFGGPPDLSTTVEAYYALRLVRRARRRPANGPRARSWCARLGGVNRARFFTKLWLAVHGPLPVDGAAVPAARDDPAAAARAAVALPLRLLGARDVRGADGGAVAPPHLPAAGRPRRAVRRGAGLGPGAARRRRPGPWTPLLHAAHAAVAAPYNRAARSPRCAGAADRRIARWILRAPGGRRLVGRHPAARGSTRSSRSTRWATPSTTR